jgi:hypothetical protein
LLLERDNQLTKTKRLPNTKQTPKERMDMSQVLIENSSNVDNLSVPMLLESVEKNVERPRVRIDKVRIIPNTMDINRDLIIQVKRSFVYIADNSTILNMMLATINREEVDLEEIKQHIFQAFSRPARVTLDENRILRLKLLPEQFRLCNGIRKDLARELPFAPDIHTVTNALLCTGDFKPTSVVVAICNFYKQPDNLRINYNGTTM